MREMDDCIGERGMRFQRVAECNILDRFGLLVRLKIFFFLCRIKRPDQFLYARRRTSRNISSPNYDMLVEEVLRDAGVPFLEFGFDIYKEGWKLKNIDKTDINKHIRRVLTKLQTHTQIQRQAQHLLGYSGPKNIIRTLQIRKFRGSPF
ncbi:hypothetical protein YC2023_039165 [Brassica napus]